MPSKAPFQRHSLEATANPSFPRQLRIRGWNTLICLTRQVVLWEGGSLSQRYIATATQAVATSPAILS